jgi:hypothetical protein
MGGTTLPMSLVWVASIRLWLSIPSCLAEKTLGEKRGLWSNVEVVKLAYDLVQLAQSPLTDFFYMPKDAFHFEMR